MSNIDSTPEFVRETYRKMDEKLAQARARLNRPLTLSEKLLLSHLDNVADADLRPGDSYINLRPDRVAHQDVTGQMAILQFMQSGRSRVAVPTTVHCDHLIQARVGASSDLQDALNESNEVYQFLESASRRYGMGFWRPRLRHHPPGSAGKNTPSPARSSSAPTPTPSTAAASAPSPSAWAAPTPPM